jgi:hypothetical protein
MSGELVGENGGRLDVATLVKLLSRSRSRTRAASVVLPQYLTRISTNQRHWRKALAILDRIYSQIYITRGSSFMNLIYCSAKIFT